MISETNRKWWILSAATITLSMIFLGQTIINVTLPLIQKEFNASEIVVQWVVNSFILFLGAFVLLGGKLADHFGTKKIFMTGLTIITSGSFLSGLSPNMLTLIVGRSIQGFGGSLLLPSLMAICMKTFQLKERGKAMGILIGVSGIFLSLGPTLGGFLTQFLNWRWVFWINIPLSILSAAVATYSLVSEKKKDYSVYYGRLIALSTAILLFVLALMQLSNWGFSFKLGGLVLLSLCLFILAVRLDKNKSDHIFDPFFLKNSRFLAYNIVISCSQLALISTIFITLYLQNILNFTPLQAGILMLPATLPQLIMGPLGGLLADKKGPRLPCFLGLILVIIGEIWVASCAFCKGYSYFFPGILIIGCGAPLTLISSNFAALAISPSEKYGLASGLISMLRQFGSSIGLAIITTILIVRGKNVLSQLSSKNASFNFLENIDPSQILSSSSEIANTLKKFSASDQDLIYKQARFAFENGFSGGMFFVAMICIVGLLISGYYLVIQKKKNRINESK